MPRDDGEVSDNVPSRADVWRCLVGYGVPEQHAAEICGGGDVTLRSAFETHSEFPTDSAVRVQLLDSVASDPTPEGELARLLTRLDVMSARQRQAVLAHHIAGLSGGELAGLSIDERDLATGEAMLALGTGAGMAREGASKALAPLADLPAPASLTSGRSNRGRVVVAAAALALTLVGTQAGLASQLDWPPGEQQEEALAGDAQPAPQAATPTVPETTAKTLTAQTATPADVEPDREVEVSVTTENTVIRQEPWTRRVIWESRPFRGAVEIVSVDPNTVTIDYSGTRILVSLTDGTLLPP